MTNNQISIIKQEVAAKRVFDYWLLRFGICLVIVSWLLVISSSCAQRQEEISESKRAEILKEEKLDQKVLQFDLTAYTDRGIKRWEVKGESANMVDEIVELKNLVATTYGEKDTLKLEADGGIYNKALNKIQLEKNVVITTSDGARVLTDFMDWDSQNNTITTDRLVEIEREKIKLRGRGAKGEPELRKIRFNEEIRIEMEEGATVITCDGPLDINYEENIAVFNNNVKIVDEKGEITSDLLEAYLNPETKTIMKAIAKGSVKILRDENYSYSDEVIYLAEEHKVILTGRPQLVIYPDEKLDASFFGDTGEQQ